MMSRSFADITLVKAERSNLNNKSNRVTKNGYQHSKKPCKHVFIISCHILSWTGYNIHIYQIWIPSASYIFSFDQTQILFLVLK